MLADILILIAGFLVVLICGFFQKTTGDRYSIMSTILLVNIALFICLYLAFEYRFDVLAISFGSLIIAHHMLIHWNTDFAGEITCCTLQLNDISNHETWIIASFTAGIVWFFSYTPCTY